MKKIISMFIVFFMMIVGFIFAYNSGWFYRASEQQKRFMAQIDAANSIIWYHGSLNPGKEISLNYKKITEFTDETIGDKEDAYEYHAIVIFDFDGKMDISDEELIIIKKYCEEKYYDLIYYGTAHLEQFKKCGFYTVMDPKDYGFTYNGSYWKNRQGKEEYINPYLLLGNWTKDNNERYDTTDEHIMWKMVISFIIDLVNSSYGESMQIA